MICDYCQRPILPGQRHHSQDDEKLFWHLACWRQKGREVPRDGGSEETEKYGVISSTKKKFLPGEPIFLIRATDPAAVSTVLTYARTVERDGAAKDHVNAAFDHAMRVAEWQRNNPEKVKAIAD